jgi:hypothetical protein
LGPCLDPLVTLSPVAREFASDGGFQEGAAEQVETLARLSQRRFALRDLREQRVDPLDDAPLLGKRRKGQFRFSQKTDGYTKLARRSAHCALSKPAEGASNKQMP